LTLVLAVTIATPAFASPDFASLRKVADTSAAKEAPGFRLVRVHLTASHPETALEIHDSEFHYFGPVEPLDARIPGVTTRVGDMPMLRVLVRPAALGQSPKVEGQRYKIPLDKAAWTMAPVPANILSPEDVVRRLKRQIPGDPHRSPRAGLAGDRSRRDLFDLKLVRVGDDRAAASRTSFTWAGLSTAFGFRAQQAEFFARTGPLGKWTWWTVIEHQRADPASDPRRAGTPRRVLEYIYVDATTGNAESHCHGADQRPIRC
jgi:hypothetical protein